MIHKVVLKNFKKIKAETFELTDFDLLVGANNSGKSTLLQALAIWQYCVNVFRRTGKTKDTERGVQLVLNDFTVLPLPEFKLLWHQQRTKETAQEDGSKKNPSPLPIEIAVFWKNEQGEETTLNIQLSYHSAQTVYARPEGGWARFSRMAQSKSFPRIVYVPPFSGLEHSEIWYNDANVSVRVGKGMPGSVLRNLLLRAAQSPPLTSGITVWEEICRVVKEWFGLTLNPIAYDEAQSEFIDVTYRTEQKEYNIIAAGSGFHQVLTLLAFYYGYAGVTTILFDEPDAHLHTNLQRAVLSYFKQRQKVQLLIATHSEALIGGVEAKSIISMLSGKPVRVQSTESIVNALSEVDNIDVVKTKQSPYILYVEGEDDERLLTAWAQVLGKMDLLNRFHFFKMGGQNKVAMRDKSQRHFEALRQINPGVKRVVLFDYDEENSFHPEKGNLVLKEWSRRNIENYLLVPEAWKAALLDVLDLEVPSEAALAVSEEIDALFQSENLTLPQGFTWRNVSANVFSIINGKKILFENENSLFQQLAEKGIKIDRTRLGYNMRPEWMHEDIHSFFAFLETVAPEGDAS